MHVSSEIVLTASSTFLTMLQDILKIIDEYCANNDIFYDETLSAGTQLIADLGLTSVDFVSIFQKCQALGNERLSFIELVMPIEGQYVSDLKIGELSDYIIEQSALRPPANEQRASVDNGYSEQTVNDSKYRRSLFEIKQFDEFKSLIQKPTFSDQGPVATDYQLVFILSSPRSGSTLLQRMLDQHPDIESPEELHLLHYDTYAQRHAALSQAETRHLLGGTARLRARINGISMDDSNRLELKFIGAEEPALNFFTEINKNFSKQYLVDKTPSYAYSRETLERISTQFPLARFIYLTRHPSAVIKSLIDSQLQEIIPFARRYSGDTSTIPEMIWALCHENIQSILPGINLNRLHYVSYEELVMNPEQAMTSILNFLHLPFYPDCANPYIEGQKQQIETNEYAGDLKFFLENRIVNDRAEIWKAFPALHSLSNVSQGLMSGIPGYEG